MSEPQPRKRNRRASIRRPPKRSTRVICGSGSWGLGPNIVLELLDISETGIRLRVSAACRRGQEMELELSSLNTPRPLKIPAEVVWCVPGDAGTYSIGLRFRRALSYHLTHSL